MIDMVKRYFGKRQAGTTQIQGEESLHDIRIATCAMLLEMSAIDGEFNELEKEKILSILKTGYNLSDEHASALLDASNEKLEESVDLWRFAQLINQNYDLDEKIQVIEMIWHIVYADGVLNKHEDYLIHKLAKLLRLTHKQLIDAKLKVKKESQALGI